MIRSLTSLRGYDFETSNGRVGQIEDFCFGSDEWKVAHVVVQPGHRQREAPKAVRPTQIQRIDWRHKKMVLQDDADALESIAGMDHPAADKDKSCRGCAPGLQCLDSILRSDVHASDAFAGVVSDLACDVGPWVVRYLVVDLQDWMPGRQVLLATEWIDGIDAERGDIAMHVNRQDLIDSPEFDPSQPVGRDYERALYDFHGRPAYWLEETRK